MSASKGKGLHQILQSWSEDPNIGCLCPEIGATNLVINRFWEELHYQSLGLLDTLIEKLIGREHFSATKDSALKSLRPWLMKIYGASTQLAEPAWVVRASERKRLRVEKGSSSTLESDDESEQSTTDEESTMSNVEIKKVAVAVKKKEKKAVAKIDVKALKKGNKVSTSSLTTKPGRPSQYGAEKKIVLLVKENPRREGSDVYDQFEILKKSKTVGEYLKKGGRSSTLAKCINRGWAKVS